VLLFAVAISIVSGAAVLISAVSRAIVSGGCHVEGYRASVNSVKAIVSGDAVLGAVVRGGSE